MTATATAPRAIPASVAADLGALAVLVDGMQPIPDTPGELAERLYHEWYLNIRPADARSGPPVPAELDLVPALAAAHAASLRFEAGWVADRVSSTGRVDAATDGFRRLLPIGAYVTVDRPGRRPEPGDRLRVAAALATVEGGFWVTRSRSWMESAEQPLTRLYLNVRLDGAAAAVALLTEILEDSGVAYALKVNVQVGLVQRADALVAYVPRDRFGGIRDALEAATATLAELGHLAQPVPRLTARLAAGVGAADGEGSGTSYGQGRCVLLAEAIAGRSDVESIEGVAVEAFRAAGLDPARPYLAQGSDRDYVPFA